MTHAALKHPQIEECVATASVDDALHVAFLSTAGALGGAERALLDCMASIRDAHPGWRLTLVVPEGGELMQAAVVAGFDTVLVPLPAALARLGDSGLTVDASLAARLRLLGGTAAALPATAEYILRLRRAIRWLAPDAIHANGFKMQVAAAAVGGARLPVIWHVHDYVSPRPVMARAIRLLARRAGAIVANSWSVAADVERVTGGRSRVSVVHNAVDLERFRPDGEVADLDTLSGVGRAPEGTVRVGLVATMAHWKGHAVFLRAFARIPRDVPIRAYIVGGSVYRTHSSQRSTEALRRLADELGIADRVGFTGFVRDTPAIMRALDIVVHASTRPEPFGLVIAEAMACGRAVIVSAAGGAAELVTDRLDALGHAPGDDQALVDRIRELAGDPELRARLGREARATAVARFARTRLADELVPIYRSVLQPDGDTSVPARLGERSRSV